MHRPPPEHSRTCSTKRTAPPARQTHTSEAGTGPALPPSHMSLSRCVRAGLPPASHLYSITPFPALSTRARPTQKKRQGIMPWRVAPQVRLELTTLRLTAECSAIELLRIIRGLFAARLPAGGSLFCFQLALALSLGHRLSSHIAFSPLSLDHRLGFAARPASARCPVLPYVWEREKLPFLPLPVDPGNFLLSQAVPSSVPSAFGGLTSVFGMGTGGALQLSSPETFPGALLASRALRFRSAHSQPSSLPLPAPSKLHRSELTSKLHTLLCLPQIKPSTD